MHLPLEGSRAPAIVLGFLKVALVLRSFDFPPDFNAPTVVSASPPGPSAVEQQQMLRTLNLASMEALLEEAVPASIRLPQHHVAQRLPPSVSEQQALAELEALMGRNRIRRSLVGLGYFGAVLPAVVRRHVLENPAWLTAYTPYQAEIAQGRLEALLNFQTLVCELTGLPVANASLLDEATAAAEAMGLSFAVCKRPRARRFLVDRNVYPQTMAVLRTRAEPLGIRLEVDAPSAFVFDEEVVGVLLQLPDAQGRLWNPTELISAAHGCGALVTVAVDPLAQVLMAPVGALGADVAVGSAQRLGLPLGYGGPHAAFFATREPHKRQVPGRIVGLSVDAEGRPALRLALQTPGTAHPAGQGHQQHLHGPGVAGGAGEFLRRLPWPRGSHGHGPPGAPPDPGHGRRLDPGGASSRPGTRL